MIQKGTGNHAISLPLALADRGYLGAVGKETRDSWNSRQGVSWVNSHENRLDGVLDVAERCPAQELPQAPLSQLCRVLLFLLWRLEGRGRPAVETEPCGERTV